MMAGRGIRGLIALAVMAVMSDGVAGAQTLRDSAGPAEVPPASYTATQYVDSRGCAFVRAGLGGKVSWVPRVSRDRRLMCGLKPSLGSGAVAVAAPPAASAPAAPAEMSPAPSASARVMPDPRPVASAPAPARTSARNTRVAAPKPASGASASPAALRRDTTQRGAAGAGTVVLVRTETIPGSETACPNAPATAERYVLGDGRRFVRCGPPVRDPVAYLNALRRPGLQVARAASAKGPVPSGYVTVWKDGRLNPARGPQTAEGDAAMAAAYGAGTPMRMKPGTALKVPYAASDGAFVQAGAFADPVNADRAVARLLAAGLPAATSRGMTGGRIVAFVLAGPADRAQAAQLLAAVRAAGFTDAYLR